jgi:hypothetical protein
VNAERTADAIMSEAQLSLTEPVAMLEGEEAPVVEAAPTDAASDEEIAAEEALLEKIEGQHIMAHDTEQTLLPEEVASDADIELELARMAAEDRGEVFVPPPAVEPEPVAETRPVEFMPQMIQEMPTEFLADEAAAPVIEEITHEAPEEIAPEAVVEPEPTVADENFVSADEASHEQVNSALLSAISAFDAFNEIQPEPKPVDPVQGDAGPGEPEVES